MSLILNIDTSTSLASIALGRDGIIVDSSFNPQQKDHAAWLHVAIRELLINNNTTLQSLDAIAVTSGPGSYTGLRVAMATAKGICYAINKPLITHNTLEIMTRSIIKDHVADLYCPMIDARRMEVFTALYNCELNVKMTPKALILDSQTFHDQLKKNSIIFFGTGSEKFSSVLNHPNAKFVECRFSAEDMIFASEDKMGKSAFADLAYAEPEYLKEFHDTFKN
jgi:tRNA threonylcarbamoyladenosine biosynthesis protein TsaB